MRKTRTLLSLSRSLVLIVMCFSVPSTDAAAQSKPAVHQTTLEEADQKTPEVTTEEVQRILAGRGADPYSTCGLLRNTP